MCATMWDILIVAITFNVLTVGQRTEKQWKVACPAVPPYFQMDLYSNESGGLMSQLFEATSTHMFGNFSVHPISSWFKDTSDTWGQNLTSFEMGALDCVSQMTQRDDAPDFCLVEMTSASLDALGNSSTPLLVPMWMELKPVLLATCIGQQCPSRGNPDVLQSLYFLQPFHSSVWSLLLLFLLAAASALFVFERTHLFQIRKHAQGSSDKTETFGFVDALLRVLLGLLLQTYHKSPRSWAGILLMLFWYAFCLVMVIAYACASAELIFRTPVEFEEYTTNLRLSPHTHVSCEHNSPWCDFLMTSLNLQVTKTDFPRDASGQLSITELNDSLPFLTDHLTASWLRTHQAIVDQNVSSKHIQWFPAQLVCSEEGKASHIPSLPLGFVARTADAAWRMNQHLQQMKQSGKLDEIFSQWQLISNSSYSLCQSEAERIFPHPVRMRQMNGPYLFMLIGTILAVIAHLFEIFYRTVIQSGRYLTRDEESGPEAALLG